MIIPVTYEAVTATLAMDSTIATLSEEGIDYQLRSKNAVIKREFFIDYTTIKTLQLYPIDSNRYQLKIKTFTGKKINLVSRSFGFINDKGRLRRDNIDQMPAFKTWLNVLHETLVRKNLSEKIQFINGSTVATIALAILAVFAAIALVLALSIGRYGLAASMLAGLALVFGIITKLGTSRHYNPRALPKPYKL